MSANDKVINTKSSASLRSFFHTATALSLHVHVLYWHQATCMRGHGLITKKVSTHLLFSTHTATFALISTGAYRLVSIALIMRYIRQYNQVLNKINFLWLVHVIAATGMKNKQTQICEYAIVMTATAQTLTLFTL